LPAPALDARAPAAKLAEWIARVQGHGALFAIDVRADGSQHAYGFAVAQEGEPIVEHWSALTGASKGCSKVQHVGGARLWRCLSTGKPSDEMAGHVRRVVAYMLKPWPSGTRDLNLDVVAAGVFEQAWMAALANTLMAVKGARKSRTRADAPGRHHRTCLGCGQSIPDGKRADAKFCSDACRKSAHRRRARSPASNA
jgi:hypothetical protein